MRASIFHQRLIQWAGAVALVSTVACRPGVPVIDTAPKPPEANGTISGSVRGPEGAAALEGRTVEAINADTGERQKVTTSNTGGYTFKLKPGRYRLVLTIRPGETITAEPGTIDLNPSDVDAGRDIVIGVPADPKPRTRAPRSDDGLGAAIA